MNADAYLEDNISKNPTIEVLKKLGYTYLSPEECEVQRGSKYGVILKDVLREQKKELSMFNRNLCQLLESRQWKTVSRIKGQIWK